MILYKILLSYVTFVAYACYSTLYHLWTATSLTSPELCTLCPNFQLLSKTLSSKNGSEIREVVKRVIAFVTLGVDVSPLFSEMVMASTTKDLVVKKMVYMYLTTYARQNPDLTLLTINTLHKDCRDEDPMVRGLALRSLCGLQLESVLEYVMQPLSAALKDSSAYVRRTGVLGYLKIARIKPEAAKNSTVVDTLYSMLRDRDTAVVTACIEALHELMAEEGGIAINQAIVHHLLQRIKDFSDWGQCVVLEHMAKYMPVNDEERFGIMNMLDPCLRVSNSAVVLATTKVFLAFTAQTPEIQHQVYERLRTPLITLASASAPEVGYVVLQHLRAIVQRAPAVFASEFKTFFCKFSDPAATQHIKLSILPIVASESTYGEIVSELSEYVNDVNTVTAQRAVRAIGDLALRLPVAVDAVVTALLDVLATDYDADWVPAETALVVQALLRRYPDRASTVIPSIQKTLRAVQDPAGRAAVVWILGEYGSNLDEAPYVLEPLVDRIALGAGEQEAAPVKHALLTAAMKLFFARPPEARPLLGKLLAAVLHSESEDALVRDRALLYYRLLRKDIETAQRVVGAHTGEGVQGFSGSSDIHVRDEVFAELNTLALVYNKPSSTFIDEAYRAAHVAAPAASAPAPAGVADDGDLDLLGGGGAPAPAAAQPPAAPTDDDDLLGGMFGAPAAPPAPVESGPALESVAVAPQEFQRLWGSLPVTDSGSAQGSAASTAPVTPDTVQSALAEQRLFCVAAGDMGAQVKVYCVTREAQTGAHHLLELFATKPTAPSSPGALSYTLKAEPHASSNVVALEAVRKALAPLLGL